MARKCYSFEFISDDRWGDSKATLKKMDKQLKKSGVKIVREGEIRELKFPVSSVEGGKGIQWRKRYTIDRGSDTWNNTFGKVNKIKAPFYEGSNC